MLGGPQQPSNGYNALGQMQQNQTKPMPITRNSISSLTEDNLESMVALINRIEAINDRLNGENSERAPDRPAPAMPIMDKLAVMRTAIARAHELIQTIDQKLF